MRLSPHPARAFQKRPPEKRRRGLIQQQVNTTYSILICGQLARQWGEKKPPACGKLHQPLARSSFALLPVSVPQMISSWNTIAKSAPFPARSCCPIEATQPLSARLQGSVRFLAIPIPAPPSICLAVDLPLAGSDTGLLCSARMTCRDSLGALYTPVRWCAHDGGVRSLRTPYNKSAEHLPLPAIYDAYESLHMLTMLSTLGPSPPRC